MPDHRSLLPGDVMRKCRVVVKKQRTKAVQKRRLVHSLPQLQESKEPVVLMARA